MMQHQKIKNHSNGKKFDEEKFHQEAEEEITNNIKRKRTLVKKLCIDRAIC